MAVLSGFKNKGVIESVVKVGDNTKASIRYCVINGQYVLPLYKGLSITALVGKARLILRVSRNGKVSVESYTTGTVHELMAIYRTLMQRAELTLGLRWRESKMNPAFFKLYPSYEDMEVAASEYDMGARLLGVEMRRIGSTQNTPAILMLTSARGITYLPLPVRMKAVVVGNVVRLFDPATKPYMPKELSTTAHSVDDVVHLYTVSNLTALTLGFPLYYDRRYVNVRFLKAYPDLSFLTPEQRVQYEVTYGNA